MQALVNGRVLFEGELQTGLAVLIDGARVSAVGSFGDLPKDVATIDLAGAILAPGFIDVQVNGGGDRLFNDDPSVDTIAAIGSAHRQFGTTGFLPTLISDDSETIEAAMNAVREAIASGAPGVLGIHIEGPFLNPAKKGIHDDTKLRPISDAEIDILSRPTGGKTVVTLAPETVPPNTIRQLTDAGVIVCAGHTQATADEVSEALDNGLRGFTHLFNAMSQLTAREPGAVGAALYDERGWCGIIVDGHHVDPRVLQLALRSAPHERFMLVSDAMPSVGGSKSFMLNRDRITVSDGKCVNAEGTLAGSDLDMASAVRNCVTMLHLDIAEALAMASAHPATFLGLGDQLGQIAAGYRASLVSLDDELRVLNNWIDGKSIAKAWADLASAKAAAIAVRNGLARKPAS